MRHSVGEGDHCIAPIDSGYSAFVPGKILFDDNIERDKFKVQFCDRNVREIEMEKVCWIPSVLYDRIVAELISPEARYVQQRAKISGAFYK